jgi:hypothetical protein
MCKCTSPIGVLPPQRIIRLETLIPQLMTAANAASTARASAMQPQSQKMNRLKDLTENQKFLIFMKVMFNFLQQHEEHASLRRAKNIVNECTKRNRMGDENYMPLQESVTVRLRSVVGELYWNLTRDYLGYGCD